MPQPEKIPDNFDVNSLREPTPQTLSLFSDTCFLLDDLGGLDNPGPDRDTGKVMDFYFIRSVLQKFNNGTTISNESFHGSDEIALEWSRNFPVRHILLTTTDAKTYVYTEDIDGNTELYIQKTDENMRYETPLPPSLINEYAFGVFENALPKAELLGPVLAKKADREEAKKLGISKVTDASLTEFNKIIQDALTSGVKNN